MYMYNLCKVEHERNERTVIENRKKTVDNDLRYTVVLGCCSMMMTKKTRDRSMNRSLPKVSKDRSLPDDVAAAAAELAVVLADIAERRSHQSRTRARLHSILRMKKGTLLHWPLFCSEKKTTTTMLMSCNHC